MAGKGKRIKQYREALGLTQEELAKKINTTKQTIYKYENEIITNIPSDKVELLSNIFNISPSVLMGWDDSDDFGQSRTDSDNDNPIGSLLHKIKNIFPIDTRRYPLLGSVACGEPRFTGDEFHGYIEAGADIGADFCLRAHGDSMTGARITDGDIVFIREQPDVENGEIAAVIIDDEATLKRVNKNIPGYIQLEPENPNYQPIIINLAELDETTSIRILGKAVAFQSDVK